MGRGPHNPNDLGIEQLHHRIKEKKKKQMKDLSEQILGKKAPENFLPPVNERVFNPEVFVSLCEAGCSLYEIERIMRLTTDNLKKACIKHFDESLHSLMERYRCSSLVNLRRAQLHLAEYNPAMAIFLGKVLLGQKENDTSDKDSEKGKLLLTGIEKLKSEKKKLNKKNDDKTSE